MLNNIIQQIDAKNVVQQIDAKKRRKSMLYCRPKRLHAHQRKSKNVKNFREQVDDRSDFFSLSFVSGFIQ